MPTSSPKFILGSRSPRRLELLSQIVPADRIEVLPPRSSDEANFDGLTTWPQIEERLREIARAKLDDVLDQLTRQPTRIFGFTGGSPQVTPGGRTERRIVIAADTVIVGRDDSGSLAVLGQPPEHNSYETVVRDWFTRYYFGRTHVAATALCVEFLPAGGATQRIERIVKTEVAFRADGDKWLDWYISTGEPKGKAGGYAIQEAGSIFAERIDGSLSNVVGLPLEALLEIFVDLGLS